MNIYFADFETTTSRTKYYEETKSTKVWLWRIVDNNGYEATGDSIETFWETVEKLDNPLIYFHYLTFDGDFIAKYLVKKYYTLVNAINLGFKQFRVFRQAGKIYSITVNDFNNIIHFRCSLLLLSSPIKELGKSLGISKYDDTYNETFYDYEPSTFEAIPKNYLEYIKRDVMIQQKSYNALQELLLEHYNIQLKDHLTITSCVTSILHQILRKYQKPKFSNKNVFTTSIEWIEPNELLMRGGLTQFNPQYLGKTNKINELICIDINSAYPFQMSRELPCGQITPNKPPKGHYCSFMKIKVMRIKPKKETKYISFFPNIPKKKTLAKVFCMGEMGFKKQEVPLRYINNWDGEPFEMWLFENELETFKRLYNIKYRVLEQYYMKLEPYFEEFPRTFYALKRQYKDEDKPAFMKMVKILLNSAFGALCKKMEYDNYLYAPVEYGDLDKYVYVNDSTYEKVSENKTYDIGEYRCGAYKRINAPQPAINARFVGAWIASQNRVRLMNTIMSIAPTKWVYCDTDSLIFDSLNEEEYAKVEKRLGKGLGEWDMEQKKANTFFELFGAKKYRIYDMESVMKEKFAGIDEGSFLWNCINEDMVYIEDATLQMKRVKDGILLVPTSKYLQKGHL